MTSLSGCVRFDGAPGEKTCIAMALAQGAGAPVARTLGSAAFARDAYVQIFDFLEESELRLLSDFFRENQAKFEPATVHKGQTGAKKELNPERRRALVLTSFEPVEAMLRASLEQALAPVSAALGTNVGSSDTSIELELAAHGDQAHFGAHRDIPIGPNRVAMSDAPGKDRIISAVYYFHRIPKGFSGGELRLYRLGTDLLGAGQEPGNHIDIEPVRNSLVAFPSWIMHEVRPVSCPSGDFRDFRFAVNCWYLKALG